MPLEVERATHDRELPKRLDPVGKYVVIGGTRVVGLYDTYEDALKVGYATFRLDPFLVEQVTLVERVQRFTRDIGATCPT